MLELIKVSLQLFQETVALSATGSRSTGPHYSVLSLVTETGECANWETEAREGAEIKLAAAGKSEGRGASQLIPRRPGDFCY